MARRGTIHARHLGGDQPDGYLDLTVQIYEEDGEWIAECLELGISSSGGTVEAAARAVTEAASVYLLTVEESGLLDRTLAEAGLVLQHGRPPAVRAVPVPTDGSVFVQSREVRIPVEA